MSFVILVGLLHLLAAYVAGGKIDPFYQRFTTPLQKSLILGTSRAAQGILPEVINNGFRDTDLELPIYNFAFTNLHSPYGSAYLKAIKVKLDPKTKNGLFILSVDPWSLSVRNEGDEEPIFREKKLVLGNINCYTCYPNFDYLFRFYDKTWGRIIWDHFTNKEMVLQKNGWLEVTIPMDEKSIQKRTREKIYQYQYSQFPTVHFSQKRIAYLSKIIDFLKLHGTVYLVRIPVIKEILNIENNLVPDFDEQMHRLATSREVVYFNLMEQTNSLIFTDGNHLYKDSAKEFSEMIVDEILRFPN